MRLTSSPRSSKPVIHVQGPNSELSYVHVIDLVGYQGEPIVVPPGGVLRHATVRVVSQRTLRITKHAGYCRSF